MQIASIRWPEFSVKRTAPSAHWHSTLSFKTVHWAPRALQSLARSWVQVGRHLRVEASNCCPSRQTHPGWSSKGLFFSSTLVHPNLTANAWSTSQVLVFKLNRKPDGHEQDPVLRKGWGRSESTEVSLFLHFEGSIVGFGIHFWEPWSKS